MIPWPAHSSKENYNIEGNLGRFQNHLQKPSCQNCIPKNQISLIKKFLCHGELLRALSFSFLLQAIVFAIFASLEQLPRFVSSLPSAGHVNDRHLANEWQNIKVKSKSCSRSHGTRFLIDSCSRTRKRRIYAAAVTPWETFHTSWAKKLNLRINYNSRVLTSSKTARQHDYKSYGIVEDKTFGRQETISCLCYQHRFSNRPESLVLLEDCRRERKMLFPGKIHRNLGWFLC